MSVVWILMAIALASCAPASAQTSPVDTQVPVETATVVTIPEPTATSAPTEPALALDVLESYRWTDPNGYDLVEALVRNPYDYDVQVYDPRVRLIDASGEIVHRSGDVFFNIASDIGWARILAGETVSVQFCACPGNGVSVVPEWETFEFVLDIEEADPVAYTTDLEVSLRPFKLSNTGNSIQAQGTLRNTSGEPLRQAFVRVFLRDADGRYVGFGIAGVIGDFIDGRYTNIEPGDTMDFVLPAFIDSAIDVGSLQVEVVAVGVIAKSE